MYRYLPCRRYLYFMLLNLRQILPFSEYWESSKWEPPSLEGIALEDEHDDGGEADDGGRTSNNCFRLSAPEVEMFADDVTNCGRTFPMPFK